MLVDVDVLNVILNEFNHVDLNKNGLSASAIKGKNKVMTSLQLIQNTDMPYYNKYMELYDIGKLSIRVFNVDTKSSILATLDLSLT